MNTTAQECDKQWSTDERLLSALRGRGPQTIEMLASLPGLSWTPVFLALDRLSRSGAISLKRTAGPDYRVSLNRVAA